VDDLDALPFPMRSELAVRAARGVSPYVLGSRGCYNQCSFCYLNSFYGVGPRWRGRSPENILSELRELGSRERFEYFYFADANFFGPGRSGQERAARLAEVLRSEFPGVGFGLECRANDIQRETMGALRAAGLRHVFIGVESGCDKTLRRMRKGVRAGTNARAVGMLRDLGIRVSLGFIMFDPDSTLEEVRESFEFLKDNGLLDTPCVTGHLLHHRARVLKGTPLFQSVCSRPGSDAGSFSGYECTYRIRDERADLLARSVEPILRYALSLVGTEQECGKGKDARLARVNQVMIDFFESALSLLEQAKSTPPEREMEELAHAMERNMKEAVS
jgi:hypothetical protein